MLSSRRINLMRDEIKKKIDLKLHTESDGVSIAVRKKACCVCDIQLDHRNNECISLKALSNRIWLKASSISNPNPSNQFFKNQYSISNHQSQKLSAVQQNALSKLIVSPRSVVTIVNKKPLLSICKSCLNAKKKPTKSIIDLPIGTEPDILACLNDTELALISIGRISGHIFHVFAGSHKSIKTWHQIQLNNIGHTVGTINLLDAASVHPHIYCILSGPFTPHQKALAKKSVAVDTRKVIEAFHWLKSNNFHYHDIVVPDPHELPMPIVLDHTEEEQSTDSNIEKTHETTVFFPEFDDIEGSKGDCDTNVEFLQEVLNSGRSDQYTLVSKPTKELIKTWKAEEFIKSFPRQFPFGLGNKPANVPTDDYTRHLLKLSNNAFQRADFILVVANIHFKDVVVRNASLKCKYNSGNKTAVERFNGIDADDIDDAIDNPSHIDTCPHSNIAYFVRSVFAISRSLPFSDDAIKDERKKLFSLCTKYGLPTGLLTITPDDSDNFNMYVYKTEEVDYASMLETHGCDDIKDYLSSCEKIRVDYPGYAEFEFENAIDIVISDIFGWDEETQFSKREGGVFGKLDAWFLAVEEQGRKTLHGHFLIWAKGWDKILQAAYSSDEGTKSMGTQKMKTFLESNVSTSCFDIGVPFRPSSTHTHDFYSMNDIALRHDCNDNDPVFVFSNDQKLRNMRFQHCPNTTSHLQLASCIKCSRQFTLDDLKSNAIQYIISNVMKLTSEDMDHQTFLRYVVSICQSGIESLERKVDAIPKELKRFILNVHRNLHRQRHTFTCFKKGSECRSKLPVKPNVHAMVEFLDDHPIQWYQWNGRRQIRTPFRLAPQRSELDVFTNIYHPFITEVLQCNTNFQCGIDGPGIMYVTCYTCKSTRTEEKQTQLCILLSLKKMMDREMNVPVNQDDSSEMPPITAFKRIFTSAMVASSDYSLSAPMAKYLVLHGTRFRCSHSFTHIPFHDFLDGATSFAKLDLSMRNTVFLSSRRDTYLFRPDHLENIDPIAFYSKYQVRTSRSSNCNNADFYRFRKSAPAGYENLGLVSLDTITIPVVYFLLFENAASFSQDITNPAIETNDLVEKQCQKILLLLTSYRSEKEVLLVDSTFKKSLIAKINSGCINPDFEQFMQNMQDCRNSLDAERVPDTLEELTESLPEPECETRNHKCRHATGEILDLIDQNLSNVIAEISDTLFNDSIVEDASKYELSKLTCQGAWKIGEDVGLLPSPMPIQPDNESFLSESVSDARARKKRTREPTIFSLTKDSLIALQKTRTIRQTNTSHHDQIAVENINPNGTCESIVAWAKASFKNDRDQSIAFQSLISDFVLQYLNEAKGDITTDQSAQIMRQWMTGLLKLRGLQSTFNEKRVIMFMTGPGGSGKSHVINNIMEYAKQFTVLLGQTFTSRTIVVTALTGVAATSILGETLHSAACINVNGKMSKKLTGINANAAINEWRETKLLIVDEVSFASKTVLKSLAKSLECLKVSQAHYGGISVCFAGDFSQLEPVSGESVYKGTPIDEWYHWINAFVELKGWHRFNDIAYKDMLDRLRTGVLSEADYKQLDERVVDKGDLSVIPAGTQIACPDNKDRCTMNNVAFQGHLKATHVLGGIAPMHTIVVNMSEMKWISNKRGLTERAKHTVFEQIGDHQCKRGRDAKFMDPFLKLYIGVPIMITENDDVENGVANGTTGHVKHILLKKGALDKSVVINIDGYNVNSIDASSVDRIIINIRRPDKSIRELSVRPIETTCRVEMPFEISLGRFESYSVQISGTQFTFLVNHATTVHKLQGQTVDNLYIVNWSYRQNWVYVGLSRIRSIRGLFTRRPLDRTRNVRPNSQLTKMILQFRSSKSLHFSADTF